VLADQIKQVEDHHLLELIATIRKEPATSDHHAQVKPRPLAVAAVAGTRSDSSREHSQLLLSMPITTDIALASLTVNPAPEHRADQEDYLWGV
jgi:hypothetical protein